MWSARRTASSGEDVADVGCRPQEVEHSWRRKRNPGAQKGQRHDPTIRASDDADGRCLCRSDDGGQPRAFR